MSRAALASVLFAAYTAPVAGQNASTDPQRCALERLARGTWQYVVHVTTPARGAHEPLEVHKFRVRQARAVAQAVDSPVHVTGRAPTAAVAPLDEFSANRDTALRILPTARFKPARSGDCPVPLRVHLPVWFRLR